MIVDGPYFIPWVGDERNLTALTKCRILQIKVKVSLDGSKYLKKYTFLNRVSQRPSSRTTQNYFLPSTQNKHEKNYFINRPLRERDVSDGQSSNSWLYIIMSLGSDRKAFSGQKEGGLSLGYDPNERLSVDEINIELDTNSNSWLTQWPKSSDCLTDVDSSSTSKGKYWLMITPRSNRASVMHATMT